MSLARFQKHWRTLPRRRPNIRTGASSVKAAACETVIEAGYRLENGNTIFQEIAIQAISSKLLILSPSPLSLPFCGVGNGGHALVSAQTWGEGITSELSDPCRSRYNGRCAEGVHNHALKDQSNLQDVLLLCRQPNHNHGNLRRSRK